MGEKRSLNLSAFLGLGYEVVKGLKEVVRIIWSGSSLGMVLDGKNRKVLVAKSGHGSII
jgi:hypothetical protein